jgi:MFS family permease
VVPAVVMGVVFVTLVSRRVPVSTRGGMTRADVRDFFSVWMRPAGIGLLVTVIGYHMAVTALMSMTPLFLQSVHGYTSASAGTVFAAALLLGALVQPWVGRVSDRVGRRRVLVAVCVVGALLCGGIAAASSAAWLIAAVVSTFGLLVGVRAVVLALAVDYASRREGTTLGFVFAIMDGVGALGAVLAGLVAESGLANAFLLAGAFALGSAVLGALVLSGRRRLSGGTVAAG